MLKPEGDGSLEEQIHRSVLCQDDPGRALAGATAAIEGSIAFTGALIYRFSEASELHALSGRLQAAFTRDLSCFEDDPCQDRARQLATPRVVHATRLLSRREYRSSVAYREFYGVHGIDYIVCMRLNERLHSSAGMCGVLLARAESDGDFDEGQKELLASQLPVLAALMRAHQRNEQLQRLLDGLATAVDAPGPLLVVDSTAEPVWVSQHALRILNAVPASRAREFKRVLRDCLAAMRGRHRARARATLETSSGGWEAEIVVLPGHGMDGLFTVRLRPARAPEAELASRYGLTPAESAVLSCLGEGMSNAAIGESLSMSSATAATHVKRVLAKLRLSSRLQAGLLMQRMQLLDGFDA